MRYSAQILALIWTVLLLIVLEIFSTTFLLALGVDQFSLNFVILITLFLAFKVDNTLVAIYILVLQWVHSYFTVQGWAVGTISGVIIYLLVGYIKELLHFSSMVSTMIVTFIAQMVWFAMTFSIIAAKTSGFHLFFTKLFYFLPEGIVLAIISPFFYALLERIWKGDLDGARA